MIAERELTNIDIFFITKEMERELVQNHARLDQFYDLDEIAIFRFKTKEGKKELVFSPPRYIFLRDSEKTEIEPSPFASSVKNLLLNRIIKNIRQLNNDRIVELEFENGSIILECTKKGNVILVSEGKIKNTKFKIEEKERMLEIGKEYLTPRSEKKEVKKEQIVQTLKKPELQNEKFVVAITRNFSFPAFYLNKIFDSEGWDPKKKVAELSNTEIERVASRIEEFNTNLINMKVKPIVKDKEVFLADDKLMEKNKDWKETSLFKELAEVYTFEIISKKEKEKGKKMKQLLDRLRHQEERMKALEIQIKEEKERGEWILTHSYEIMQLINEYKRIKGGKNKEELEKFLKENNLELVKNGIKIKTANS
ncbi:MAG: NFACT family protein [Candidatus Micrarchaeia archaeon]